MGQTFVYFRLTRTGSRAWCAFTGRHVNHSVPVVVDDVVLTDPVIKLAICTGESEIGGVDTNVAYRLAGYLNSAPLPVGLRPAAKAALWV